MDRDCAFLTCCDCIDSELRSGVNITADEDIGLCGLIGLRISYSTVTTAKFNLGTIEKVTPND